jgi:type VI secretion system secreted protein VgrG
MSAPTQKSRFAAIGTPLGADVLLLKTATVTEQLGRLFQIDAHLISSNPAIKFNDLVGQNVTLRVELHDRKTRYFNGYVSRFVQSRSADGYAHYHATIVPWLWFLTRSADCRIFQEMTVPEIIQKVFRDHGFTDFKESLTASYRKWDYCVQYRETDFNFVSRLMEQEGIYYFFEHENGKHTLVLADSASAHKAYPGFDTILYRPEGQMGSGKGDVTDWSLEMEVQPGTYALNDFNFEKPKSALQTKSNISRTHAGANFEIYDYPGEYTEYGQGESYAKVRIEELQAQHEIAHANSNARGVATGATFKLSEHPRADQNREYLITGASYQIDNGSIESGGGGDEEFFSCRFTTVEAKTKFRPVRTTPKPLVQGPQTAIIVGPKGEEIYTDKFGRVKVQFHWDRYGKADENSSCWIRVSSEWAGKKWGAIYLPRIGQEVIVEFLEGDPDHPIITGRVYNADAMPPYDLPAQKTKSTLKSNSSKGGQGFNEIRFEDKKGEEQLFVHAEKNEDIRVKNDTMEWIGNDRHLIVKKDQIESVEGDKHLSVKGDRLEKIEGDHGETIKGDRLASVEGGDHVAVKGDQNLKIDGDNSVKVAKNINQEAGMKISVKGGTDIHEKAGMNFAVDAGMAVHIKAGMTVVIEAGVQLSLKVGGNFIDINPAGVFIKGTMVMINTGGAAGSGGGSSPTAPTAPDAPDAPKAPVEADNATSGEKSEPPPAPKPPKPVKYSSSAKVLKYAAEDGTPFCEKCEEAKKQQAAASA